MAVPVRVRCRPIGEADLDAVAALLAKGFPARRVAYWSRGLARLGRRTIPEGLQRYGYMLDAEGAAVGAILVIAQQITHDGAPYVRCNMSSWYVEPAFRSHAAMLGMVPLRFAGVTFLNISPAPNTWPLIEAQGFQRYTFGQRVVLPLLARGGSGRRIAPFGPADAGAADLPEAAMLADHVATGCLALVGHGPEGRVPFLFLPFRAKQGRLPLPGVQLVYCRDTADLVTFAAPLGRFLARRGTPFVVHDTVAEDRALPGLFVKDRARKYFRGPHRPRLGDMAYTEFTIFGA